MGDGFLAESRSRIAYAESLSPIEAVPDGYGHVKALLFEKQIVEDGRWKDSGNVIELRCTADFESKSGGPTSNRKVKGTIHWVSAAHALDAEIRLYDRLFTVPEPDV